MAAIYVFEGDFATMAGSGRRWRAEGGGSRRDSKLAGVREVGEYLLMGASTVLAAVAQASSTLRLTSVVKVHVSPTYSRSKVSKTGARTTLMVSATTTCAGVL